MQDLGNSSTSAYPVSYDVDYPESLSRLLIFVKWLLAIPHYVILYALQLVMRVITFLAIFAVLFTGKYPEGLWKFNLGVMRWNVNVGAYVGLLRDEYPPFSFDAGQYPVRLDAQYPSDLGRFAPLYQWFLAIPHLIILMVLILAALVVSIIAWFAILFTGRYPRGLFDFNVGVQRWTQRVTFYVVFMTGAYPPFSLSA